MCKQTCKHTDTHTHRVRERDRNRDGKRKKNGREFPAIAEKIQLQFLWGDLGTIQLKMAAGLSS